MSAPQSQAAFTEAATRPLRIGFISPHNPHDRCAFNGTVHQAALALGRSSSVALSVLGGHRPLAWHHRVTRRLGRRPALRLDMSELEGLDAVVGMVATGALNRIAAVSDVPLVHVTDATPVFLRDFYRRSVTQAQEEAEAQAIAAARLVVYSSHYMAERAREEFGRDLRNRIAVIPFGANCTAAPATLPKKAPLAPVRLLWVGSDWHRKGGEIALAALAILRSAGLDVELTLAGHVPPEVRPAPGLRVAGYLNKNRPREAARLEALYAEAHVLVLPTRADCTPMVLAEAGAFGTPVIATDTGGIGTLVSDGVNGRMLPPAAVPADWARAILEMTRDPAAHGALCRSSFDFARSRLTWTAWARDLVLRLRIELAAEALRRVA